LPRTVYCGVMAVLICRSVLPFCGFADPSLFRSAALLPGYPWNDGRVKRETGTDFRSVVSLSGLVVCGDAAAVADGVETADAD
jgi:hypothetical protein